MHPFFTRSFRSVLFQETVLHNKIHVIKRIPNLVSLSKVWVINIPLSIPTNSFLDSRKWILHLCLLKFQHTFYPTFTLKVTYKYKEKSGRWRRQRSVCVWNSSRDEDETMDVFHSSMPEALLRFLVKFVSFWWILFLFSDLEKTFVRWFYQRKEQISFWFPVTGIHSAIQGILLISSLFLILFCIFSFCFPSS